MKILIKTIFLVLAISAVCFAANKQDTIAARGLFEVVTVYESDDSIVVIFDRAWHNEVEKTVYIKKHTITFDDCLNGDCIRENDGCFEKKKMTGHYIKIPEHNEIEWDK